MTTSTKVLEEMSGHTPGPWKVWHSGYANAPFVIYAGMQFQNDKPYLNKHGHLCMNGLYKICESPDDESPDSAMLEANADLIGAAPELLVALESALKLSAKNVAWADQARAAIAKAKGLM